MTSGKPLSRVDLHTYLWDTSDSRNRIEIHQHNLAAKLGVTNVTVSKAIKDLVTDDRIRKISAKKGNVKTYLVKDPADFLHEFVPVKVPPSLRDMARCTFCGELRGFGNHFPPVA